MYNVTIDHVVLPQIVSKLIFQHKVLFHFSMWSRAVWNENKPGDTCGPVPSNWIKGDTIFWPLTKESAHFKKRTEPVLEDFNWQQFPLVKVKFSTNVLSEARSEKHDTPDTEDASFFVPTSHKRKSKPRADMVDQIPLSAVGLTTDDDVQAKKKLKTKEKPTQSRLHTFQKPSTSSSVYLMYIKIF